jgi:putative hydrolase
MKVKIIADLHTHTTYSEHAFSTATEMITRAQQMGYEAIAITDHGPGRYTAQDIYRFHPQNHLPKKIGDFLVLYGIEANITNTAGELDISDELLADKDWVIASVHSDFIPEMNKDEATQMWLNLIRHPMIDMMGHPEEPQYEFDMDIVFPEVVKYNKVVEFNGNSLYVRPAGQERMKFMALKCKEYGCKIAINSDAHSIYSIGRCDTIYELLKEIDYPEELIINSTRERLLQHLKERKKHLFAEGGPFFVL